MKRIKVAFLFLAFVCAIFIFTQCDHDHSSTLTLKCYKINEDNDTIGPVAHVWVEADTSRFSPHHTTDTLITTSGDTIPQDRFNFCSEYVRAARGYTNNNGSIVFPFPQPLLLNFNAYDTIRDEAGDITAIYKGKAEVLLLKDQDVECDIYLTPYSK